MAAENSLILDSRFRMALFLAFAGAGLMLACAGVYGVTSYTAEQRTQEIGIRMALGASRGTVLRMIIAQSAAPLCIGVVGGIAAAAGLTRLLESYLFGVAPRDPIVFIVVPILLAFVASVANAIPALRSSRIDPMTALKYE
jgi:ABC-type antimicrobial peptide transport system permease subunit